MYLALEFQCGSKFPRAFRTFLQKGKSVDLLCLSFWKNAAHIKVGKSKSFPKLPKKGRAQSFGGHSSAVVVSPTATKSCLLRVQL